MRESGDQFNEFTFDDVYVLTLPAFVWIKVNAQNDPDGGAGRNRHTCNVRVFHGILSLRVLMCFLDVRRRSNDRGRWG